MGDVDPGTSQFYAFDNGAWTHYGTCGAISWQINEPSGNPVTILNTARRLVVTYHVPYKYDHTLEPACKVSVLSKES